MDKAQARVAAEKIEKGIDLYGAGDWQGAARELQAALEIDPSHARARECLGWVRDVIDGKRTLGPSKALDEDALRAVDDALADEPAGDAPKTTSAGTPAISTTTRDAIAGAASPEELEERRRQSAIETRPGTPLPLHVLEPVAPAAPDAGLDAQWDPVPLTPSSASPPVTRTLPDQPIITSAPPLSASPSSASSSSASSNAPSSASSNAPPSVSPSTVWPPEGSPIAPEFGAPSSGRGPSSSPTLLGLPQSEAGAPADARKRTPSSTLLGLSPASSTGRDHPRLTPTPRPMPPVDDESPDSVTREWQPTPTGTNLPPLDVPELTEEQVHELLALDNPLLAGPRDTSPSVTEPRLLEFEAEPTPEPHLSPLKREPTTPDYRVHDFDQFEQTPTRDRSAQLRALGHAPTLAPHDLPDLNLQPLDSLADEGSDSGRHKTNPFVKSRIAEYAPPATTEGSGAHALPPPPRPPAATELAVPAGVGPIVEALGRGDTRGALSLSEELVASAGGIEAESCRGFDSLLEHVYNAMLGGLQRRPRHGQVTPDLDPRSAFLLSRLDGSLTFEDLLDVSGMTRVQTMRILALMIARGVVLAE